MQLISAGNFYLGYEDSKFCDISIHLGNFLIEYQCPSTKNNVRSIQVDNGRIDGEALTSD